MGWSHLVSVEREGAERMSVTAKEDGDAPQCYLFKHTIHPTTAGAQEHGCKTHTFAEEWAYAVEHGTFEVRLSWLCSLQAHSDSQDDVRVSCDSPRTATRTTTASATLCGTG